MKPKPINWSAKAELAARAAYSAAYAGNDSDREAWGEIAKALRLADERNELAAELRRRETADLSDVIQAYEMRGDGCQAAGAIVLRRLPDNDATPFVVHFRNDADSERMGRPCYYHGDYCANLADAWAAFGEKIRRYDPTGTLAA